MKKNKDCLKQLFKDKNNCYSLREIATALLIIALFTSWIAQQFFHKNIPEYMFYSFASLIGAGCFGYSIERRIDEEGRINPDE
jgi:hypothetical protein